MTIANKEQISSLASHILFDYATSLKSDDEFKNFMQEFDRLTGGCLSACHTLLTAKLLLKEQNLQENQS